MTVKIASTWLDHDGGTKFYQLFDIVRTKQTGSLTRQTHGAVVAHYGPQSAVKGGDRRPISGGQCKVYSEGQYRVLLEEKQRMRNGGRYEPTHVRDMQEFTDEQFCDMLRTLFPTAVREQVLAKLGLDLAGNGMPVTDTDNFTNDPLDEPRDEPETPFEAPEGWGAW